MLLSSALSLFAVPSSLLYLQSFQFLIDASEFQIAVHAVTSNQERKDGDCYEEFLCIVNEYIKDNSNSEINIDSRAKQHILKFEARSSYASLDTVREGVKLNDILTADI